MSDNFQLRNISTVEITVARRDPNEEFDSKQQGFRLKVNFSIEETIVIADYKLELIVPSVTGGTVTRVRFAHPSPEDLSEDDVLAFLGKNGLLDVYPYLRTTARTIATMLGTSVRMPETLPEGGLEPDLDDEGASGPAAAE